MTHTPSMEDESGLHAKLILVVEDDRDIGAFFEALSLIVPYQFVLTTNASQALERLQTLLPHLLILDYRLPGMSGLELYDRLQSQEQYKHLPVLLISANISEREVEKRPLAFLKKPFDLEELLSIIEELLGER